jgi:hypothetical protein
MEALTRRPSTSDRVFSSFRYSDSKVGLLDHTLDRVPTVSATEIMSQFRRRSESALTALNPWSWRRFADYAGLRDGGTPGKAERPTSLSDYAVR